MTNELKFKFQKGQEIFLLEIFQMGSGAHAASYPRASLGSFPMSKVARV
jgi:hypothetical protein